MAPKVATHWSKFKAPSTVQQRIAFLDACQREFEKVSVVGPVSADVFCMPAAAGSAAHTTNEISSGASGPTTFVALDDVPTPAARPSCHVCASACRTSVTANPLSDWNVFLCPQCSSVSV